MSTLCVNSLRQQVASVIYVNELSGYREKSAEKQDDSFQLETLKEELKGVQLDNGRFRELDEEKDRLQRENQQLREHLKEQLTPFCSR